MIAVRREVDADHVADVATQRRDAPARSQVPNAAVAVETAEPRGDAPTAEHASVDRRSHRTRVHGEPRWTASAGAYVVAAIAPSFWKAIAITSAAWPSWCRISRPISKSYRRQDRSKLRTRMRAHAVSIRAAHRGRGTRVLGDGCAAQRQRTRWLRESGRTDGMPREPRANRSRRCMRSARRAPATTASPTRRYRMMPSSPLWGSATTSRPGGTQCSPRDRYGREARGVLGRSPPTTAGRDH